MTDFKLSPRRVYQSASFYPISLLYLSFVGVLIVLTLGWINLPEAVVVAAFLAVLALLAATLRELRKVHKLVDGQRTELLARIDQLANLLQDSGVVVPQGGDKEHEARQQQEREGKTYVDDKTQQPFKIGGDMA